jgi:hypothetical protein
VSKKSQLNYQVLPIVVENYSDVQKEFLPPEPKDGSDRFSAQTHWL